MLFVGCGTGDEVADFVAKANKNNVSKIASSYVLFQMNNGFNGPKDAEELKEFLRDPKFAPNLEMMGIDSADMDAMFVSERDNEPIKVRWEVKGSSLGCTEPIAFEATGVKGTRLVAFATGVLEEVDDDQTYNDMFEGKYTPGQSRSDTPKFDGAGNPIN